MPTTPNPYNLVDYPGQVFSQAHPRRLQVVAHLHGLKSAALETCRVLELGCGDGGHLMAIAAEFPQAQCVGIDMAESGILRGRAALAASGIGNVRLEQADIMDLGVDFGEFDYIIAHGVYSWVPPAVRDRLLSICRANLAPNGVAYVSFHVLPGGHLRRMMDEMLLWHTREENSAAEQVARAREFSTTLVDWAGKDTPFGVALVEQRDRLATLLEHSVYHDNLSTENTPVLFSRFVSHAGEHGLQYLGEAHVSDQKLHRLAPSVLQSIGKLARTRVEWEQYVDFALGAVFRQSLLCRNDVVLCEEGQELEGLYVAAKLDWPQGADLTGSGEVAFRAEMGVAVTLNVPLLKQALVCLDRAWPRPLSLDQWLEQLAGQDGAADVATIRAMLRTLALRGYAVGVIELWATPLRAAAEAGEWPKATALARWEAGRGARVGSLRGQYVNMEDVFSRCLLQLLDGQRDRGALCAALWQACLEGNIQLPLELRDCDTPRLRLPEVVDRLLGSMARLALLVE